ncbi:Aldo-keto reductase [Helicobacter heilmannii]|nr:Aldo-keto reductase [Helicobacter heilmannii]
MTHKQLGQFKVSPLALGCMGMSFGYGEVHDKKEMIKLIHKAFELGINFFDTA